VKPRRAAPALQREVPRPAGNVRQQAAVLLPRAGAPGSACARVLRASLFAVEMPGTVPMHETSCEMTSGCDDKIVDASIVRVSG
jgi:hypothetical protein